MTQPVDALILSDQPAGVLSLQAVAMPSNTNWSGDVFGGWLVSQMDLAGAVYARLYSKGRVVTVSIDKIVFLRPVKVGSILACYTRMLKVGNTSMQMLVDVWEIHDEGVDPIRVTHGVFTFVALDNDGHKRTVPPLAAQE